MEKQSKIERDQDADIREALCQHELQKLLGFMPIRKIEEMKIDEEIGKLLKEKYKILNNNLHFLEQVESMLISLKSIRESENLKLRDVEEKTGISNAYLSQLESGKIKNPSWEVVRKLFILYYKVEIPISKLT